MAKKNRSTMTKYRSSLGRPKTTDPKILQQTMEEIMQRKKMDSQNVKMDSQPVRARMLADVQKLVSQERNKEYGEPRQNMARTAAIMAAYLGDRPGSAFRAEDVAAFGIILKLGRLAENPHKLDSWRDVAGYAAIGYEVVEQQQPRRRGRPPKQQ